MKYGITNQSSPTFTSLVTIRLPRLGNRIIGKLLRCIKHDDIDYHQNTLAQQQSDGQKNIPHPLQTQAKLLISLHLSICTIHVQHFVADNTLLSGRTKGLWNLVKICLRIDKKLELYQWEDNVVFLVFLFLGFECCYNKHTNTLLQPLNIVCYRSYHQVCTVVHLC